MEKHKVYEYEARQLFEDYLNDCEPEVTILGMNYPAGYALRLLDEVAFEEEMRNWIDVDEEIEII